MDNIFHERMEKIDRLRKFLVNNFGYSATTSAITDNAEVYCFRKRMYVGGETYEILASIQNFRGIDIPSVCQFVVENLANKGRWFDLGQKSLDEPLSELTMFFAFSEKRFVNNAYEAIFETIDY